MSPKLLLGILALFLAPAARCGNDAPAPPSRPSADAAVTRCRVTGCSGQLCADEDLASTCEWREEYACYRSARCERQADGRCSWTMDPALRECLERAATRSP